MRGAVLLPVSDAGGHISGRTIVIDGGAAIIWELYADARRYTGLAVHDQPLRAAVLTEMCLPCPYAVSRTLQVAEVELEPPGPGEVLLSIRAAGLYHSDLSVIGGVRPPSASPGYVAQA